MTFREALTTAKTTLRVAQKEERVAELLLMHVSQWSNAVLFAHLTHPMPASLQATYFSLLGQHIDDDVPLQHLTEEEIFFGYAFKVNRDVLIPRFETEELVERVLALYDEHFGHPVHVVDMGTGSGAIAISLAKEEPSMQVSAVDISEAALHVAKENARRLNAQVQFFQGSWCDPLTRLYDIVVANPPYIPDSEALPKQIAAYEPDTALYGGVDGLAHYRTLYGCISASLAPHFLIAVEHGFQQAQAVQALAQEQFPAAKIWSEQDMQRRDRFTFVLQT